MTMLPSMTLTLMQGHSGSAKYKTKKSISIELAATDGRRFFFSFLFTSPWLNLQTFMWLGPLVVFAVVSISEFGKALTVSWTTRRRLCRLSTWLRSLRQTTCAEPSDCPHSSRTHWLRAVRDLFFKIHFYIFVFIYWRFIAPSTAQGHLTAFYWIKFDIYIYTSWMQCKICTFYKRKTYQHNPRVNAFGTNYTHDD